MFFLYVNLQQTKIFKEITKGSFAAVYVIIGKISVREEVPYYLTNKCFIFGTENALSNVKIDSSS